MAIINMGAATWCLDDIDLLEIGNEIQLVGGIWGGKGKLYLVPLPDEDLSGDIEVLRMDAEEFERFLNQADVVDVKGPGKAILRKSQRLIDQWIAWKVYRRDGFRCRYCGAAEAPLTVDHIIRWENGGATIPENLISACRSCNKTRGPMEYDEWMVSPEYVKLSSVLCALDQNSNRRVIEELDRLRAIKVKPRSR